MFRFGTLYLYFSRLYLRLSIQLSLFCSALHGITSRTNLNISADQFSDLINCIFDFTKRLAEANNFNTNSINRPKYFKKKTSDDLKYYLNMQKQIFEQAA